MFLFNFFSQLISLLYGVLLTCGVSDERKYVEPLQMSFFKIGLPHIKLAQVEKVEEGSSHTWAIDKDVPHGVLRLPIGVRLDE